MSVILLTRSDCENAKFIRSMKNAALNFSFINCPLFEYQNIDFDYSITDIYSDIIISSKYAAKLLPPATLPKNIWVVGQESAEILAKKNYRVKYIADNFAQLLKILPKNSYQNMVYLSGKQVTNQPPKSIKRWIIYQVNYRNSLALPQLEQLKQGVDYVMLYSANAAKTFLKLLKLYNLLKIVENSTIIAISLKVAEISKPYCKVIYCEEGQHQQMGRLLIDEQRNQHSS